MKASISFRSYETRTWEGQIDLMVKAGEPEPSADLLGDSIKDMLGASWTAHVQLTGARHIHQGEIGCQVTYRFTVTVHQSGDASNLDLPMHRRMEAPDPQDYTTEEGFAKAQQSWLTDGIY
jgi:hypothetical protein